MQPLWHREGSGFIRTDVWRLRTCSPSVWNPKITIIAGSMDGKTLDKAGVEALAKMPSLDEMPGKLVGLVNAPAAKIARVVKAPAGKMTRAIKARENQLQQGS